MGRNTCAVLRQMLQNRQTEGRCFSRSCLRDAENIASRESKRHGLGLNGSRPGVAFRGKRAQKRLGQAESYKCRMSHKKILATRNGRTRVRGCLPSSTHIWSNGELVKLPCFDRRSKIRALLRTRRSPF